MQCINSARLFFFSNSSWKKLYLWKAHKDFVFENIKRIYWHSGIVCCVFNNIQQIIYSTELTSDHTNKHYCSQAVLKTIFRVSYQKLTANTIMQNRTNLLTDFIIKHLVIISFGTYLSILKPTDKKIEHLEFQCYCTDFLE